MRNLRLILELLTIWNQPLQYILVPFAKDALSTGSNLSKQYYMYVRAYIDTVDYKYTYTYKIPWAVEHVWKYGKNDRNSHAVGSASFLFEWCSSYESIVPLAQILIYEQATD